VPDISYGAYDELGQKRVFFSPPQQDKPASKDDFEESSSEENVFQPDYSNAGRLVVFRTRKNKMCKSLSCVLCFFLTARQFLFKKR
jgi:hypothetical protein